MVETLNKNLSIIEDLLDLFKPYGKFKLQHVEKVFALKQDKLPFNLEDISFDKRLFYDAGVYEYKKVSNKK